MILKQIAVKERQELVIKDLFTPPQLAERKVVYWFQLVRPCVRASVRPSVSKNVITQV